MVAELAKNAVIIKCGFENARITGNYECAYALGILNSYSGKEKIMQYDTITQLKDIIIKTFENENINDGKIMHLYEIVKDYEPSEVIDIQVRELYDLGYNDKKI